MSLMLTIIVAEAIVVPLVIKWVYGSFAAMLIEWAEPRHPLKDADRT